MSDSRGSPDRGDGSGERQLPRHSWASMLRTARAPVAVLLTGGIGLAVPPQTRDMLAFLGTGRTGAAVGFYVGLAVLGGTAWFWSRAALAARFAIDDRERRGSPDASFDWGAFAWLPRLVLAATFLVGSVRTRAKPDGVR
jgi:hypothetical protein